MEGSEEMEKELVGLLREGVRVKELLAGEGVHVKLKDNLGEFV